MDLDGRPREGMSVPEPLERSVLDVALEDKYMAGISTLEPLEHSVLEVIPDGVRLLLRYGVLVRSVGWQC